MPGPTRGAAAAIKESREGTKYRAHRELSHTHLSPPKPYLRKGAPVPGAAFAKGRLQDASGARRPPPRFAPAATMTVPQLQRRVVHAGPRGVQEMGRRVPEEGGRGLIGKGVGKSKGRARARAWAATRGAKGTRMAGGVRTHDMAEDRARGRDPGARGGGGDEGRHG